MPVGIIGAGGKLKTAVPIPVSHPYDRKALSLQPPDHVREILLRHDPVGVKGEDMPSLLIRETLNEASDVGGLRAHQTGLPRPTKSYLSKSFGSTSFTGAISHCSTNLLILL